MSRILTTVALALCCWSVFAQSLPDNLSFEHIPVPGTIQSSITEDIFQDPYGMLWVAKDALYRYNGRDFKKYDIIFPDSGRFSSREITRLSWDANKNRLLIGTRNYGIVQYTYESDKLIRLPSRDGVPIINDININGNDVWAVSFTSGFFRLLNDTLVRDHRLNDFHYPTEMVNAGRDVWIGYVNGMVVLRNNKVVKNMSLSKYNEYYPNSLRASALMFDHLGHLWIGTERDGILVIDTLTMQSVKKFSPKEAPFYNSITAIVQDHDNLVWVGTRGGGLVVYSPETDSFKQIHRSDREEGSISGDNITSACVDATGIVWIGGAGEINKYDKNKIKFQHFHHDPKNPNTLTDDNIRNIFQDEDGLIYVATSGGYVNSIDRATNTVRSYRPKITDANGLLIPLSIASYSKDILLVGSSAGLLQFDKRTKEFSRFLPLKDHTFNAPVRQIIRRGNDFVFLIRGKVLYYEGDTKKAQFYDREQKIDNALAIGFDNRNRMWVGTREGVVYADQKRETFNVIKFEHDHLRPDSSAFFPLSIQAIGNNLWVNSFNNAIYIVDLNLDPPRVTERITSWVGLPDNTVYASIPDGMGKVWISHNSGLSSYDEQTHQFTNFSVSEGLQDEEFNRLAFFKSPSGEIMLGGINGLNIFDPKTIRLPVLNLSVHLVEAISYPLNRPSVEGDVHSLIKSNGRLNLAHDNNSLQFSFFVPDYHEPVRYRIRYRLEPFDASWTEADRLISRTYANLNPGNYTFTVKVTDPAGRETIDKVLIVITPPYWKTWWFMTLFGIVCSMLVASIIYSSVQSTRREKARLEELLKVRTREIEQSREELENLNKKKDLIFAILSHDLRSPLTTLKGFLGLLIDHSESLSTADLQRYATSIRNSVTTSLDLIDNTLFWSLSQTGNIQCNPTSVQLMPVFEKIKGLYQLTAERKHLTINFPNTNGLAVYADENMVYVLLRNLVSNAIKFTPEMNTIRVDASDNGEEVSVSVKDSGIGMTSEEINKIFLFDNPMVKKGTSSEKGTGLGLILCKKFVEANKGRLLIESKPGVGSMFTVVLPKA